jgi:hypothetical protein
MAAFLGRRSPRSGRGHTARGRGPPRRHGQAWRRGTAPRGGDPPERPPPASPHLLLLPPPYSSLLLLYYEVKAADLGEIFPKGGGTGREAGGSIYRAARSRVLGQRDGRWRAISGGVACICDAREVGRRPWGPARVASPPCPTVPSRGTLGGEKVGERRG